MKKIIGVIHKLFQSSVRLHSRHNSFSDPAFLISLIDRFIDGNLNYPLEWDDFISWENQNSSIETMRVRIASLEHLAFSRNPENRVTFVKQLVKERNNLASLIGAKVRDDY